MYIEKRRISPYDLKRISVVVNIVLLTIFIALLFAFWNIQIIKSTYYSTLATGNILKQIEIKAPRGLILDCNHKRLSENKINFNLFVTREYVKDMDHTIAKAASITGMDAADIRANIDKYKGFPKSFRIPIKKNLSLSKVIYIESRSDELPEFEVDTEPARAYPYNQLASHILGYISELTEDELKAKASEGYKMGDLIGKNGIEKIYEKDLKGVNGVRNVVKDNMGKIREVLSEEIPTIGNSVVLTIDLDLQRFIENIFDPYKGTAAVVDLKTGGILAMVSKPNFDPEFFTGTLNNKEWNALINDPDKPLHNKFTQGLYLPGSVFKIVMALTALEEKEIDPTVVSSCAGQIQIYDRVFHCWNRSGHGAMNLHNALKNSCNIFFYKLGKKIDIDVIYHYATMLGLGVKTNIDLPNEKKGFFPNKAWKQETMKQKWFPGETISVAIGGGVMNVSPAQLLTMISTVALRGRMPQFHLLKQIEKDGKILHTFTPSFRDVPISRESFEIVIEGLYKVINDNGTGRAAKIDGLDVCGKTGTQLILSLENPNYKQLVKQDRFKPHAWFVSFAPRNNPRIAMVIFVENGGDAGAVAVPIATQIYKEIFFK